MERYSTLYGAYTITNASGKEINQYIEIGRSAGLDDFLRSKNIPNPALAVEDVNAALTGFVKLPGYDEQPADCYPMLVRYAPMHLKRLDKYNSNVISFNSIACSAPDHQVGNRDGKYRNTHYIDRDLLLNVGEYNFLDHIFGTQLVTWKENQDAKDITINYDAPPVKVQPVQKRRDAVLVQMAAAALCNKAAVILKLEKGCIFQLRSMELLKQIYAMLAPIQAAEIGFASYEEPSRIPQLIADTTIRMFVVPAEVELGALANQPNMLVLDLNQKIKKPEGTKLLQSVSTWYKMEWKDRVRIMNVLFADMYDPNDAEGYVERTFRYKKAYDSMLQMLEEKRDSINSLEDLKKLHDSFGDLMTVPMLREKFCAAAPRLIKLPPQYTKKTKANLLSWLRDEMVLLGADAVMAKDVDKANADKKRELYVFSRDVFKVNFEVEVSQEFGQRRAKQTEKKKDADFAAEREANKAKCVEYEKKLQAQSAEFDAKFQAQDAEFKAKFHAQNVEFDAKFQAQNAEFEAKREDLQRRAQDALTKERANTQKVQNELEQERAATDMKIQTAVRDERSRLEKKQEMLVQEHNAEISKLNARHQNALTDKDITIEQQKKELQQKDRENQQLRHGKVPMIRFCGMTIPEMAKSLVIFVAMIGLVVGLLVGGLTGGFIGHAMGEPDETKPVETTVPVTEPIETKPAETTVPATEPAEPMELYVDGEINWDYVYLNVGDIVELVAEPTDMEALFNEMGITAEGYEGELEAVMTFSKNTPVFVTVQKVSVQEGPDSADPAVDPDQATSQEDTDSVDPAADPDQATSQEDTDSVDPAVDPDQTTDENADQDAETATEQTEPELRLLDEMVPALVLDNGTYRIEVFCGQTGNARNAASNAAQALFRMLTDDTAEVVITGITDDGMTLDLHSLMTEVSENELWWKTGFNLDLDKDARYTMQQNLGTGSEPIMLIHFEDESEALLYDYSSKPKKLNDMVQLLEDEGYAGAYVDTIVIGLSVKEEVPETTDAPTELPEQSTADEENQDNT